MKKKFETNAIRTQTERSQFLEHSTPMYLTSSFVFEDAEDMRASFAEEKDRNIYSRYSNPTSNEFINKVCQMEGAATGFAFASGMAAVFSTLAALKFYLHAAYLGQHIHYLLSFCLNGA